MAYPGAAALWACGADVPCRHKSLAGNPPTGKQPGFERRPAISIARSVLPGGPWAEQNDHGQGLGKGHRSAAGGGENRGLGARRQSRHGLVSHNPNRLSEPLGGLSGPSGEKSTSLIGLLSVPLEALNLALSNLSVPNSEIESRRSGWRQIWPSAAGA